MRRPSKTLRSTIRSSRIWMECHTSKTTAHPVSNIWVCRWRPCPRFGYIVSWKWPYANPAMSFITAANSNAAKMEASSFAGGAAKEGLCSVAPTAYTSSARSVFGGTSAPRRTRKSPTTTSGAVSDAIQINCLISEHVTTPSRIICWTAKIMSMKLRGMPMSWKHLSRRIWAPVVERVR